MVLRPLDKICPTNRSRAFLYTGLENIGAKRWRICKMASGRSSICCTSSFLRPSKIFGTQDTDLPFFMPKIPKVETENTEKG